MKKYYLIFAAALACLAAACNDNILPEELEESETDMVTYITACVNDFDTKSSIDGTTGNFTWNTGDQIALYTRDGGTKYMYKYSDPLDEQYDGKSTAVFAFSGTNALRSNRIDYAFYPASILNTTSSSSISFTLPTSYPLEKVAGERCPTPMAAEGAMDGTLQFKQICSMLRVKVKDIPATTTSLQFRFTCGSEYIGVTGNFLMTATQAGEQSAIALSNSSFRSDASSGRHIITVTMDGNNVWRDELDINLPVPIGANISDNTKGYESLQVTTLANSVADILSVKCKIKDGGLWRPARRGARKMTAPLPVFTVKYAGEISKIIFAPGNLQWQYRNGTSELRHDVYAVNNNPATTNLTAPMCYNGGMFFFAQTQYGIMGKLNNPDNRSNRGTESLSRKLKVFNSAANRIDLFVFASSGYRINSDSNPETNNYVYKPFAVCDGIHWVTNGYYGNKGNNLTSRSYFNWGFYNDIALGQSYTSSYGTGVWDLLDAAEWYYLLNDRPGAKQKRGFGTIFGRKGLILLPDNWTWTPSDEQYAFVPFENNMRYYDSRYSGDPTHNDNPPAEFVWKNYSAVWGEMQAAGAVFLPAGGSINPSTNAVVDDGESGYYWTASAIEENGEYYKAYCLNFGVEYNAAKDAYEGHWRMDRSQRHWCRSIRLIHRVMKK